MALDASAPGAYGGTDFDNRGPANDKTLQSTVNGFLYAHAGAQAQFGAFGISGTAELFQYAVTAPEGDVARRHPTGQGVTLVYGRYHALAGYGFLDNQLVFGAGARIVTLQVKNQEAQSTGQTILSLDGAGTLAGGQTIFNLDGAGPEVGAVWKPNGYAFRVGATFRSAVGATVAGSGFGQQVSGFLVPGGGQGTAGGTATSTVRAGDFVLPAVATLPWELEVGFAVQLGPRPLNPRWLDPHEMERTVGSRVDGVRAARRAEYARELAAVPAEGRAAKRRAQAAHEETLRAIEDQELAADAGRQRGIRRARESNWPRERITILGSLLVTGPSTNAVSLEGFASQRQETVGKSVTLTPHLGLESEPVPHWVAVRAGTYLEPSRFADATPRQHFTLGGDVRLIPFSPWGIFGDQIWKITIAADLAPRYQNYGIGLGAWH